MSRIQWDMDVLLKDNHQTQTHTQCHEADQDKAWVRIRDALHAEIGAQDPLGDALGSNQLSSLQS